MQPWILVILLPTPPPPLMLSLSSTSSESWQSTRVLHSSWESGQILSSILRGQTRSQSPSLNWFYVPLNQWLPHLTEQTVRTCNCKLFAESFVCVRSYWQWFCRFSCVVNMAYTLSYFSCRKTWFCLQQTQHLASGRLMLTTLIPCCWMDSFWPSSALSNIYWKTLVTTNWLQWAMTGQIAAASSAVLKWSVVEVCQSAGVFYEWYRVN